jgi:cohesin loading factor subunit SCC2
MPRRSRRQSANGVAKSPQPKLSKVARKVKETVEFPHRYPTPTSPENDDRKRKSKATTAKQATAKQKASVQATSASASASQAQLNSRPTPPAHDTLAAPVASGVEISVPLLSSLESANYKQSAEHDSRLLELSPSQSRKRKREVDDGLDLSYDQRQKADTALDALEQVLDDLFEAENTYQPDAFSSEASEFFQQGTIVSSDTPILTKAAQSRLESTIQRAVASSAFKRLDAGQIVHVQKLCEGTVACASRLTLNIEPAASESDVEEWIQSLDLAETALQGAKIILRTMTAGREDKQLYSEDTLGAILIALDHIIDRCIIPVIEARQSGNTADVFKHYSAQKKQLATILQLGGRVLRLLGDLVSKVDFAETAINQVESLSTRLIFVENAPFEKEAVLGIQRFESFRRTAMDALAKIFAKHPGQRIDIFNEILSSLEKLPVTRQSARQFKLAEGKPIQLVSALLMRLIQTSATWSEHDAPDQQKRKRATDDDDANGADASAEENEDEEAPQRQRIMPIDMDRVASYTVGRGALELQKLAKPLNDSAYKNASHVVSFLLQRALNSTKSGDLPYRNLLDIFTEDFLNVLGQPDWPAADLFLQIMLSHMLGIMDDDKRAVPHKNLALDLMGTMGSGIIDLETHVKSLAKSLQAEDSPFATRLRKFTEAFKDEGIEDFELASPSGPYRLVIEHLSSQGGDAQNESARGLLISQWSRICLSLARTEDEAIISTELLLQLRNTVPDHAWLRNEYEFPSVDGSTAKLAFGIITLASKFCKCQQLILKSLLSSMNSPHPTLKAKSLKCVPQLLEKDPSILDRGNAVIQYIIQCSEDSSPMVRDSALGLLAKCLVLKPSLEGQAYIKVVTLSDDENTTVRKKAMKILKDVYLRNDKLDMRAIISAALLKRVKDDEQNVAEGAQQHLEELWIAPFHSLSEDKTPATKLALQRQVYLIIRTLQRGEGVLAVLEALLRNILSKESKHAAANFKVCEKMVAMMFDAIIDNETAPERPAQHHVARTLTVFARVDPKLFTAQQLGLLEPYVKNLASHDNLSMYRAAVIIFRHVLPSLSTVQHDFLRNIRSALMTAVPKVPSSELPDTAMCLWIIKGVLKDMSNLTKLMLSLLKQIDARKDITQFAEDSAKKFKRYIDIAGPFGKACDFDEHASVFRKEFPNWKGSSVSGLIIDIICPFTKQKLPQAIRESALESIAMICQAWPQHYLRSDVGTAFELVFRNDNTRLQAIVLEGFRLFFVEEERRSESGAEIKVGGGAAQGQERLAKSFVANDNDGAVTTIAQRFLQHILRIALATTDDLALAATQVVASINRQGLVHPKECGPALVALETSTNKTIAAIAFEGHKALHQKHETMFEKEYMKAVNQAFEYQRDVIEEPRGITLQPYVPKLRPLFEVLKSGSSKVRKRFLTSICSRMDFELPKLEFKHEIPSQVVFARFVVENLAFFDYGRIDELLHLISCLEKMVVAGTGTGIAHAIELEVLKVKLRSDGLSQPRVDGIAEPNGDFNMAAEMDADATIVPALLSAPPHQPPQPEDDDLVDPIRLRQLAVASMILTMVWETRTHLRTLWGLQKHSKTKISPKDFNKAPTRVPFVSGEKFVDKVTLIMQSLTDTEAQLSICKSFAELLAVDHELKVEDDDDMDLARQAAGYETPSEGEGDPSTPKTGSARSKKRKPGGSSAGPTPKKMRKSSTPTKKGPARARKRSRAGSSGSASEDGDYDGHWD